MQRGHGRSAGDRLGPIARRRRRAPRARAARKGWRKRSGRSRSTWARTTSTRSSEPPRTRRPASATTSGRWRFWTASGSERDVSETQAPRPSGSLAAEDVLRRYGPSKATVVDVARALGVSHGSVYRHFPSKAALRDAVTECWLARISGPLDAVAQGEEPGAAAAPALARSSRPLQAQQGAGGSRALRHVYGASSRVRGTSCPPTWMRSSPSSLGSSRRAWSAASSTSQSRRRRLGRSSTRRRASTTRYTQPSDGSEHRRRL